jgi:hypothetical protein
MLAGVPTFCRHNRLIQNCSICAREQDIELRPLISPSAPSTGGGRHELTPRSGQGEGAGARGAAGGVAARRTSSTVRGGSDGAGRRPRSGAGGARALTVRRMPRGGDDGYRSALVPGLKSTVEAERLAEELAFSAHRLVALESEPPGLYGEVADPGGDLEERTWLAFQIAYLCPLEEADPFASIRQVRTSWSSGELPELGGGAQTGPRSAHTPSAGNRTFAAYRTWAARAGSQSAAFTGDPGWSADRRFGRVFERLALPGLHRDARFDLLLTLGALGVYEVRPDTLHLGGENSATVAAKRAFGIGDSLLLERRARDLAEACSLPLGALDLALHNFEAAVRVTMGLGADVAPDPAALAGTLAALGL